MANLPKLLMKDGGIKSDGSTTSNLDLTKVAKALGIIQQKTTDSAESLDNIEKNAKDTKGILKTISKNTTPKGTVLGSTKAPEDKKQDVEDKAKKDSADNEPISPALSGLIAGGAIAAPNLAGEALSNLWKEKKVDESVVAANEQKDRAEAERKLNEAGYSTVTGRAALSTGKKELQAADMEQAAQASAARSAIERTGQGRAAASRIRQREAIQLSDQVYQGADTSQPSVTTPELTPAPIEPTKDGKVTLPPNTKENISQIVTPEPEQRKQETKPVVSSAPIVSRVETKPVVSSAPMVSRVETKTTNTITQPSVNIKVETYDAEKFRTTDPENFNKMVKRTREIERELIQNNRDALQSARPRDGLILREKIRGQAQEKAQAEFADKIQAAGASSKAASIQPAMSTISTDVAPMSAGTINESRSRDLGSQVRGISTENIDLNRNVSKEQSQPIVVNNSSMVATDNYIPIKADVRSSSAFSRFNDRNSAYL